MPPVAEEHAEDVLGLLLGYQGNGDLEAVGSILDLASEAFEEAG